MFFSKVYFKCLSIADRYLLSVINYIKLKSNSVKYKSFPKISGLLVVRNRGKIEIGEEVLLTSRLYSNPVGGRNQCCLFTTKKGQIIIGNKVGISNAVIFSTCKIEIEDNVLIGGGVQIFDTDFHSTNYSERIKLSKDMDVKSSPVLIKKGAFIGANAMILKGVVIGEKSIVASGAVVSKEIPDGEIWGGNPARFIKNN